MQDRADLDLCAGEGSFRLPHRESSDPYHPFGLHDSTDLRERLIADALELRLEVFRKLVGSEVGSGLAHEHQRTVVDHEEPLEEALRGLEAVSNPAPEPRPAHFALRTLKSSHRSLGVL